MKPGRNDPCPCGSGRKYKQCCLLAERAAAESPQELVRRRLRRLKDDGKLTAQLLRFIQDVYGPQAIDEAWDEFTLWEDELFDPDSTYMPLFMPWLFSQWAPDPQGTTVEDATLHDVPPARAFLQRKGGGLDPLLREYLESCLDSPLSFYEIAHCEPGRSMRLRDVLTGEEHEVLERSASQTLQAGDLLFGQVAGAQGVNLLEACGPLIIPPIHKVQVIDLRQQMEQAPRVEPRQRAREYAAELRNLYLDLADELLNPRLPRLKTTDGEDLMLQKLVFDIESAQAAFDALKDLDFQADEQDLLADAERAPDGTLRRVSIDWKKPGNAMHKQWSNTILGHIHIAERRMTVEVNSNERAAAFRKLVEERLGDRARYRMSEVQSADKLWAKAGESPPDEHDPLMQSPELQAAVQEYLARHYEAWLDEEIPALGGRTPRQAVETADGRERVEALLRDFERHAAHGSPAPESAVFQRMRRELGL
jgi:hypothetical protein